MDVIQSNLKTPRWIVDQLLKIPLDQLTEPEKTAIRLGLLIDHELKQIVRFGDAWRPDPEVVKPLYETDL